MRTLLVVWRPSIFRTSRTCIPRHRRLASGIGIATRSRRLTVTPGRFSGVLLPRPLLVPALEADVPQGQRLHRRGLPGVVRSDEDHRIAELDLDLAEALEVAGDESGQHVLARSALGHILNPSVFCRPGALFLSIRQSFPMPRFWNDTLQVSEHQQIKRGRLRPVDLRAESQHRAGSGPAQEAVQFVAVHVDRVAGSEVDYAPLASTLEPLRQVIEGERVVPSLADRDAAGFAVERSGTESGGSRKTCHALFR